MDISMNICASEHGVYGCVWSMRMEVFDCLSRFYRIEGDELIRFLWGLAMNGSGIRVVCSE